MRAHRRRPASTTASAVDFSTARLRRRRELPDARQLDRRTPGPVSDYTGQQIYYRSIQRAARPTCSPSHDYLWRWDTDWFWCSRAFGAQNPWVRRLWPRRLRRSDTYWKLVGARPPLRRRRPARAPARPATAASGSSRTSRCRSSGWRSSSTGFHGDVPSRRSGCARCVSAPRPLASVPAGPGAPMSTSASGPRCPAARMRRGPPQPADRGTRSTTRRPQVAVLRVLLRPRGVLAALQRRGLARSRSATTRLDGCSTCTTSGAGRAMTSMKTPARRHGRDPAEADRIAEMVGTPAGAGRPPSVHRLRRQPRRPRRRRLRPRHLRPRAAPTYLATAPGELGPRPRLRHRATSTARRAPRRSLRRCSRPARRCRLRAGPRRASAGRCCARSGSRSCCPVAAAAAGGTGPAGRSLRACGTPTTRDAKAISHHYDVSNRFYEWVLGPSMAYTCAVYPTADATLEEAQHESTTWSRASSTCSPGSGCSTSAAAGAAWSGTPPSTTASGRSASPCPRQQAEWAPERDRRAEGLPDLAEVRSPRLPRRAGDAASTRSARSA